MSLALFGAFLRRHIRVRMSLGNFGRLQCPVRLEEYDQRGDGKYYRLLGGGCIGTS
jgi:hypothetical protein